MGNKGALHVVILDCWNSKIIKMGQQTLLLKKWNIWKILIIASDSYNITSFYGRISFHEKCYDV